MLVMQRLTPSRGQLEKRVMNFQDAIKTCLSNYAVFEGRASRSEYWWFILFTLLVGGALSVVSEKLNILFEIAVFLPSIAAAARRLHDTNRSGWMQLIALIPVLGFIILIVFLAQDTVVENNQHVSL